MMETLCIDSPCRRGLAVPKAYSCDLRERIIEAVAAGASRREAAERFEVSVASAVKWVQRWRDDNSAAAKPRGGSVSPKMAPAVRQAIEKAKASVRYLPKYSPDLNP